MQVYARTYQLLLRLNARAPLVAAAGRALGLHDGDPNLNKVAAKAMAYGVQAAGMANNTTTYSSVNAR